MNQAELVAQYQRDYGAKFNEKLFIKDENEIIEYLKKIILACERSRVYMIKVVGFKVVEDLDEIKQTIIDYEREKYENKKQDTKGKSEFNSDHFNYIDLRESYIKLLVIRYYVSINNEYQYFTVLIKIPRIIDKYYFMIYGKYYLAINQIIDASTYNNTKVNQTKTKKKQNISFRTIFMKTMMYRNTIDIKDINKKDDEVIEEEIEEDGVKKKRRRKKNTIKITYYTSSIFTKNVLTFKYIFAKFGFYEGLDFMNMRDCIVITRTNPNDPEMYTFARANKHIYFSCPKMLFDNQPAVQSMIYTVYKSITKEEDMEEYHLRRFWLKSLGFDFGNQSVEKGVGILDSFENIYESIIRDGLHLPIEKKKDMYDIIKWMLGNYTELRQKNNHNISTKRIRWALYLACHYSASIANGLYRIADSKSKSADYSINAIRKAIVTDPDILLKELSRGNKLVMSKNCINSDDALNALKFSFKGLGGIGDSNKAAVSNSFRSVDPSHIGRIDVTYSSNNDPGMSGIICPMADVYDDSFSEYEEPNSWDEKFSKLIDEYRSLKSQKDAFVIKKECFNEDVDPKKLEMLEDTIPMIKSLIVPWRIVTEEELENYKR